MAEEVKEKLLEVEEVRQRIEELRRKVAEMAAYIQIDARRARLVELEAQQATGEACGIEDAGGHMRDHRPRPEKSLPDPPADPA